MLNLDHKSVIRAYLDAMEVGDLTKTLACFSDGATIKSPVYGDMPAHPFYERLFSDTISAEVHLINIYSSIITNNQWIAHFDYSWIIKDGKSLSSNLIDIFTFNDDDFKIRHLHIIFDRGAMN
jgi:ketosteroid isomerase-like protein